MPMPMVSVNYLFPTTSQLYNPTRRRAFARFESGLTRIPFYLVCVGTFPVVGLTRTNLSYNRLSHEQPSSVFRIVATG